MDLRVEHMLRETRSCVSADDPYNRPQEVKRDRASHKVSKGHHIPLDEVHCRTIGLLRWYGSMRKLACALCTESPAYVLWWST